MFRAHIRSISPILLLLALTPLFASCAGSGQSRLDRPPATSGTHTVLGRAFFPGGVMILMDAHLREGVASGSMQYSRVESRQENAFRVDVEVRCVGLFKEGSQAVVAGPVSRVDGDLRGTVGIRDWWVIQIEEGGPDGDRVLSVRQSRDRALTLCHSGPRGSANLKAVDGNLSIL